MLSVFPGCRVIGRAALTFILCHPDYTITIIIVMLSVFFQVGGSLAGLPSQMEALTGVDLTSILDQYKLVMIVVICLENIRVVVKVVIIPTKICQVHENGMMMNIMTIIIRRVNQKADGLR